MRISTRRCRVPQACELLLEAADPAAGKLAELGDPQIPSSACGSPPPLAARRSEPVLDPDQRNLDARKVEHDVVGVNPEAL